MMTAWQMLFIVGLTGGFVSTAGVVLACIVARGRRRRLTAQASNLLQAITYPTHNATVLARSAALGLVAREGERFALTEAGRAFVRERIGHEYGLTNHMNVPRRREGLPPGCDQ